jgi:hypothetical protein
MTELFAPPDDDEPRLPPDEVRARIDAMKALLPGGGEVAGHSGGGGRVPFGERAGSGHD